MFTDCIEQQKKKTKQKQTNIDSHSGTVSLRPVLEERVKKKAKKKKRKSRVTDEMRQDGNFSLS